MGSVRLLTAGAHLFAADDAPVRENDQGYVTSAGFSPTQEGVLALGFVKNGRQRIGEKLKMVRKFGNLVRNKFNILFDEINLVFRKFLLLLYYCYQSRNWVLILQLYRGGSAQFIFELDLCSRSISKFEAESSFHNDEKINQRAPLVFLCNQSTAQNERNSESIFDTDLNLVWCFL